MNHAGEFVIPAEFSATAYSNSFSEGLAAVELEGRVGYIDHAGAFSIPRQFVAGTAFGEGYARVVSDGPCVYFDPEELDPCAGMDRVTAPRSATEKPGVFSWWRRECKWKFIDKHGRVVSKEYDGARGFHEGLAAVKIGRLWGFVDTGFKMAIPPSFESVQSFSDGLALVAGPKGNGFIDRTGALKIPAADIYKTQSFSDGLTTVGDVDQGFIYVDTTGKQAIPQRFVIATRFLHGLAHVKISGGTTAVERRYGGGSFAYIDTKGKKIFSYQVEDARFRH